MIKVLKVQLSINKKGGKIIQLTNIKVNINEKASFGRVRKRVRSFTFKGLPVSCKLSQSLGGSDHLVGFHVNTQAI